MARPVRTFDVEHLPSGLTRVYAYVGIDRIIAFSMLTADYHRLSEQDVREAIDKALELDRPPLKVRRTV